MHTVRAAIQKHSDHKGALSTGAAGANYSPYKKLGRKILCTWILLLTWWPKSPDAGLNIVTSSEDVNVTTKVLLNVIAEARGARGLRGGPHR